MSNKEEIFLCKTGLRDTASFFSPGCAHPNHLWVAGCQRIGWCAAWHQPSCYLSSHLLKPLLAALMPGLVLTQADAPQVDTILSRYSDFECDTCEDHGTTLQEVILSKTKKCPDQLKCDPNMKQKLWQTRQHEISGFFSPALVKTDRSVVSGSSSNHFLQTSTWLLAATSLWRYDCLI